MQLNKKNSLRNWWNKWVFFRMNGLLNLFLCKTFYGLIYDYWTPWYRVLLRTTQQIFHTFVLKSYSSRVLRFLCKQGGDTRGNENRHLHLLFSHRLI